MITRSLLGAAVVGAIPSLAFQAYGADNKAQNRQPNIIYILADDLGYGELGRTSRQHRSAAEARFPLLGVS